MDDLVRSFSGIEEKVLAQYTMAKVHYLNLIFVFSHNRKYYISVW